MGGIARPVEPVRIIIELVEHAVPGGIRLQVRYVMQINVCLHARANLAVGVLGFDSIQNFPC